MSSSILLRGLLPAGFVICAVYPIASSAQAVDYGTLEQVFGEPITASVTGKPQRASEVPGDITIITQDDIRRTGATDIPTILQFVTGLDVRRNTFGDAQVAIRGYDSPLNPRLLVLVDGRQIYVDDFGKTDWNALPVQLSEIRQIEIVKGPATALFGFNAASGVINIITYDPLLDNVNTATVRGGTQGYGEGDAVATQHIGHTAGVRISVGGWTATGFDDRMGATDPLSSRYASVNIDTRWQITPKVLLSLEGGDTDARAPLMNPIGGGDGQDRLNFIRFGAAADTKAGQVVLDVYRNQAITGYGLPGNVANSIDDVFVTKLSDLVQLNSQNTARFGIEYRNNGLKFESQEGGALSYNNYSASGMWDWQISPLFDLTNSVRLDHLELQSTGQFLATPGRTRADYDKTQLTVPSFNSGLVIKISDRDTVRVTAARGLQVPSLLDFGVQAQTGPVTVVGNPALAPVSVWNAELGYDRSIAALGATFTTAIYWQRNTDLIATPGLAALTVVDGALLNEGANEGSSNELGLEIGLHGKTNGDMRWNISYRYASIHDDISSAVLKSSLNAFDHYDSGTPANEVIAGLGYTIGKWELDGQARYQSQFLDYTHTSTGNVPFIVDHYVVVDARVGYQITKYLIVAATAQQFDVPRVTETAFDYVNRQFIASATLKW